MILLDTDHISALQADGGAARDHLLRKMDSSEDQDFAVTIISLEEQMRGWLAEIHGELDFTRQVGGYERLAGLTSFYSHWTVVGYTTKAASQTIQLKKAKVRIGTMDLKIASIAKSLNVLLLTANEKDFGQVPGLRRENWLR